MFLIHIVKSFSSSLYLGLSNTLLTDKAQLNHTNNSVNLSFTVTQLTSFTNNFKDTHN